MEWRVSQERRVVLDRPRIMGILNVTPDSFSDGGSYGSVDAAVGAARRMIERGADVIDIGGESTRPGAERVSAEEQIRRVVPVVRAIRESEKRSGEGAWSRGLEHATRDSGERGGQRDVRAMGSDVLLSRIPISVDTTLVEVARAALDAGADAINDVSAGEESEDEEGGMFALTAERGAGLVLMHRLRKPSEDRYSDRYDVAMTGVERTDLKTGRWHGERPEYGDVVAEVREYLRRRAELAMAAGVRREAIVVDPGLGFGKTVEQNLELIRRTSEIASLGFPVLSGLSRKSFVGRVMLGRDSRPEERVAASVEMSVRHREAGASIFRVHDVAEHVEALGR